MEEQIKTYMKIPKIRLLASLKLDFELDYKLKKKIRDDWVRDNKCHCCSHPKVQDGTIVLTCNHIKDEWAKETGEIEKRIDQKTKVMMLKSLCEKMIKIKRGKEKP